MSSVRLLLKNYVFENGRQGDIQNIIDTIDQYGWTKQWLMNIGDRKGKILDQAIQTRKPKTVLELGTSFFRTMSLSISFIFRYISWL
jgi:predicted O-methyltransferase YrrM